jgi:energy-converting hydrogenase Eha subunit C
MNTHQLITAAAILVGIAAGVLQRRSLAKLKYRHEEELSLPQPGQRYWVILITAAAALSITAANDPRQLPSYAPLILTGAWLAAADLDVMRLPNKIMLTTGICTIAGTTATLALLPDPLAALANIAIGLLIITPFLVLAFSNKGLGAADGKLAAIFAIALAAHHPALPAAAILAGSTLTVIWALTIHKQRPFPYGPGLLLGSWLAALIPISTG